MGHLFYCPHFATCPFYQQGIGRHMIIEVKQKTVTVKGAAIFRDDDGINRYRCLPHEAVDRASEGKMPSCAFVKLLNMADGIK